VATRERIVSLRRAVGWFLLVAGVLAAVSAGLVSNFPYDQSRDRCSVLPLPANVPVTEQGPEYLQTFVPLGGDCVWKTSAGGTVTQHLWGWGFTLLQCGGILSIVSGIALVRLGRTTISFEEYALSKSSSGNVVL
jgi:hypothetical protein